MISLRRLALVCLGVIGFAVSASLGGEAATLATDHFRLSVDAATGQYRMVDAGSGVEWTSGARPRMGQVTVNVDGKRQTVDLAACEIRQAGGAMEATFRPVAGRPELFLRVAFTAERGGQALSMAYQAAPGLNVESIRILDGALAIAAEERGFILVPVREGLLIPADSGTGFARTFDTYAYEGCHMAMLGLMKRGSALLITWEDPYTAAEVRSTLAASGGAEGQVLSLSMTLRKSARSVTLHFLGKGDQVEIARAYRPIAKEKGWLVTWDQKLKENPDRRRLFGAVNYKLWSTLDRRMNQESTQEQRVTVNWTFDEAAQIAEHLKNDLKLEKVHFLMGGWIHRGYDNQHPDILPAAPECGGNEGFADAARRIRGLGYLLGLHDNYQDMYRDAPSFSEDYIQRNADGSMVKGGHWAGGQPLITCSQKAVELARRPQNLPAVRELTKADTYFIDTTYAAGLQECFDPRHPLTRLDDMKWKQAISDYGREVFGIFGSECGREWAIPHSDYFEGMTGVSGTYYHDGNLVRSVGGTVVPLFEMVYRDCIAMYGKYGYDIHTSAEYVLHHISIGRTMHHHNIPRGLYWKNAAGEAQPLALQPAVAELKQAGARQFTISYRWMVEKAPPDDWNVFVHFTDTQGEIKFQGDYRPAAPTSKWQSGEVVHGPFTVNVPEGLSGTFDIRVGLFKTAEGQRAMLRGRQDRERRCMLGKVRVADGKIEFIDPGNIPAKLAGGDPGLYVRGDGGWAEGMHPLDRFVKNTYEVLSPLNELTSEMLLTEHAFLTADRQVRRTVFARASAVPVRVVVNGGAGSYRCESGLGGEVVLPPNGFLVESPGFVAFCASSWGGMSYESPALFTLRSLDERPLSESRKVRVYHGFGDSRVRLGGKELRVDKEAVIAP